MSDAIHSHAFNFGESVESGVDPRTGQYSSTIALIPLQGNHLNGPDVNLTLHYHPLSPRNRLFGEGWSLGGLSFYDTGTKTLSVSTGETFKILESDQVLQVKEQKVPSFKFLWEGDDEYLIVHKSGLREYLSSRNDNDDIKVPIRIVAPNGRSLKLTWNGTQRQLDKVEDEHQCLLQCSYPSQGSTVTTLTYFPHTPEAVFFTLNFTDGYLSRLEKAAPRLSQLGWEFQYYDCGNFTVETHKLLRQIAHPTGLVESVEYAQHGHQLPNNNDQAPFSHLPHVTQYTRTPGHNQPPICTYYSTLGSNNFLGHSAQHDWHDTEDNLHQCPGDYQYTTMVSTTSGSQEIKVTRTYNKLHLLTQEVQQQTDSSTRDRPTMLDLLTQGRHQQTGSSKRVTRTIEYYADDNLDAAFDEHVSQCHFPKKITVSYEDLIQGTNRSEITEYAFDEWGNPTLEIAPTGVKTTFTYYSEQGETGCPADTYGFRRWMKTKTIHPADTQHNEPVRTTHTKYRQLDSTSWLIVPYETVTYQTMEEIENDTYSTYTVYRHVDQLGDPHYGCLEKSTMIINSYVTRQDFNYQLDENSHQLMTTTTHHRFDTKTTTSATVSSLSGLVLSKKNLQGVEAQASYDAFGRLLKETVSPGTVHEATRHYAYQFMPYPIVTVTDVKGAQTRYQLDGLGRHCQTEQQDVDHVQSGREPDWRITSRTTYDALGRQQQQEVLDWFYDAEGQVTEQRSTQSFHYDDWGQCDEISYSDGRIWFNQQDLSQLITQSGWQGAGITKTQYNVWGNPLSVQRYTAQGTSLYSEVCMRYDGWGRAIQQTDAIGHCTAIVYDHWNRITEQHLADSTEVHTQYASHSQDTLPTQITVHANQTEWTLGNQCFDGLGRPLSTTVGGRTTTYTYQNASPLPASIQTARNTTLNYDYNPQLGHAITSLDVAAEGVSTQYHYSYDPQTAQPVQASQTGASAQRNFTYYPSGLLQTEQHPRLSGSQETSQYTYSFSGKLQSMTDVLGQVHHYAYDAQGRLERLSTPRYEVKLQYNALSQLSAVSTTDKQTETTATRSFSYDEWSRPVRMSYIIPTQVHYTIQQSYNQRDQLVTRRLTQGDVNGPCLREEQYQYDARGRCIQYNCIGSQLPQDPAHRPIQQQTWTYDALNNLQTVTFRFTDGTENQLSYVYQNADDPTQVSQITQTNPAEAMNLAYDVAGHLSQDAQGRTWTYDAQGRLIEVRDVQGESLSKYHYDALNALIAQTTPVADYELIYQDNSLSHERCIPSNQPEDEIVHAYLRVGSQCLAQLSVRSCQFNPDTREQSYLIGTDTQQSALSTTEVVSRNTQTTVYTPAGDQATSTFSSTLGFHGERCDPVTGCYPLGKGYRTYDPRLGFFHAPDSLSPFGVGGLNPYAYCLGDPVNRFDPTGHFSFSDLNPMNWSGRTWTQVGVGIVVGIAVGVATGGVGLLIAIPAAVAASATSDVVSGMAYDAIADHKGPTWESVGTDAACGAVGGLGGEVVGRAVVAPLFKAGARAMSKALGRSASREIAIGMAEIGSHSAQRMPSSLAAHSYGSNPLCQVHFFDHFEGRAGAEAFMAHGTPGVLVDVYGVHRGAGLFARDTIGPIIRDAERINPLVRRNTLTLLACHGAEPYVSQAGEIWPAAGQAVADMLNRPVIAFEGPLRPRLRISQQAFFRILEQPDGFYKGFEPVRGVRFEPQVMEVDRQLIR